MEQLDLRHSDCRVGLSLQRSGCGRGLGRCVPLRRTLSLLHYFLVAPLPARRTWILRTVFSLDLDLDFCSSVALLRLFLEARKPKFRGIFSLKYCSNRGCWSFGAQSFDDSPDVGLLPSFSGVWSEVLLKETEKEVIVAAYFCFIYVRTLLLDQTGSR